MRSQSIVCRTCYSKSIIRNRNHHQNSLIFQEPSSPAVCLDASPFDEDGFVGQSPGRRKLGSSDDLSALAFQMDFEQQSPFTRHSSSNSTLQSENKAVLEKATSKSSTEFSCTNTLQRDSKLAIPNMLPRPSMDQEFAHAYQQLVLERIILPLENENMSLSPPQATRCATWNPYQNPYRHSSPILPPLVDNWLNRHSSPIRAAVASTTRGPRKESGWAASPLAAAAPRIGAGL